MDCRECGRRVERAYRFCPWCATPQRRKLTEFFAPHRRDHGRALRVSWYLSDDPHVRFSVWNDRGVADGAVSLDEQEARRLGQMLTQRSGRPRAAAIERIIRSLVR